MKKLSVIIPCRNAEATIAVCLDSVFAAASPDVEIIVVDDASTDNSREIVGSYPCRLISLPTHLGAAAARNRGVGAARANVLFFTDADCVLLPNTLSLALDAAVRLGPAVALGGSYTIQPYDDGFYGRFQSAFIHRAETKQPDRPDYLATHAFVIHRETFRSAGGFAEPFLPILEDVEFSHRLKRRGVELRMVPGLLVRHIFGYGLLASLRNGQNKARYWTRYSLQNRDLAADSGTASRELKANVVLLAAVSAALVAGLATGNGTLLALAGLMLGVNILMQRNILRQFRKASGSGFAWRASLYYMSLYAAAVGFGAAVGCVEYLLGREDYRNVSPLLSERAVSTSGSAENVTEKAS